MVQALRNRGVQAALLAALLFGAGTPIAKLLLGDVSPWMLAGLLYCGSGIGLGLIRLVRRSPAVRLPRRDVPPLLGAIIFGGIIGPVLLMFGLMDMPASGASLLLNAEAVFTALLAWLVFKEHFDRRIGLGMLAIVAGAALLSVPSGVARGSPWPALAVLGACLAWGLDNNLTRKVSLHDATWLACVKGLMDLGVEPLGEIRLNVAAKTMVAARTRPSHHLATDTCRWNVFLLSGWRSADRALGEQSRRQRLDHGDSHRLAVTQRMTGRP
jgi:uncharacterized membrane protein